MTRVYGMPPDNIGPDATEEDLKRYQELLDEELAKAGVDADVKICSNWSRFTSLPFPGEWPELDTAIECAWERFCTAIAGWI